MGVVDLVWIVQGKLYFWFCDGISRDEDKKFVLSILDMALRDFKARQTYSK
jgi:hypothetical protein